MKRAKLVIFVLFSVIGLQSCLDELENPGYSEVPHIELEKIEFIEVDDGSDTLKIRIRFRDGDSDLGLSYDDDMPPFHYYNFPRDSFGNLIRYNAEVDSFSCKSYYITYDAETFQTEGGDVFLEPGDVVRVERNKYGYNFHLQFLTKEQGRFIEYDYKYSCSPLWGRFPRIDPLAKNIMIGSGEFNALYVYQETPWEGTITYQMVSPVIKIFYGNRELKARVQIYDRALNESNVIESEPFTLESISEQ